MKKALYILILLFIACDKNDSDNNDSNMNSENEFVRLFPEAYPITSLEIDNNHSIVMYSDFGLKISEVDSAGEIVWTQEHNLGIDLFSNSTFFLNDLIYSYTSNENGLGKTVFNLSGDVLESELLTSIGGIISKDNNYIYNFTIDYNSTTNTSEISYKQYSLLGNLISEGSFSTDYVQLSNNDIIVKNNLIYIFDESDFQGSPNFYENYFSRIYDLDGNLINTINTETDGLKTAHSKLVLDNGNILMSIYNFQDDGGFVNIDTYDLRLYSTSGDLINTQIVNSYSNVLKLELLSSGNVAIAGGRDSSLTELKLSQFTVFDQNLNEIYTRNIGGYDEGDVFFKLNESNEFYYLLGRTDDSNGDYDLPNNSSTSDMFYFKLEK
jgi:hypothetical protein